MIRVLCVAASMLVGVASLPVGALAQAMPETPSWDGPSDGAAKTPQARTGKTARQGKPAAGPTSMTAPMRRIDRDEIDMSGTGSGRDVKGNAFRPMMNGGQIGMGGAF